MTYEIQDFNGLPRQQIISGLVTIVLPFYRNIRQEGARYSAWDYQYGPFKIEEFVRREAWCFASYLLELEARSQKLEAGSNKLLYKVPVGALSSRLPAHAGGYEKDDRQRRWKLTRLKRPCKSIKTPAGLFHTKTLYRQKHLRGAWNT